MQGFTVRASPRKNECLTSYLLRVSYLNRVHINDVIRRLNKTYSVFDLRKAHSLDINPSRVIDISKCTELLTLDKTSLHCLTIKPILSQFISDEYLTNLKSSKDILLNGLLDIKHRRYCILCLQEEPVYKIYWQYQCVSLCDKHLKPLRSECFECGRQQPYLHKELIFSKCFYCKASLISIENIQLPITEEEIKRNQWIYDQILCLKKSFFFTKESSFNQKGLIYKILFLCSNKNKYFDINKLKNISRDSKYKFIKVLKDERQQLPIFISLTQFINILWRSKITIKSFDHLSVPKEFIASIDKYIAPDVNIKCLASWCDFFCSGENLYKISTLSSKTHTNIHICLGCCLKFGYNKSNNEWEEYGDIIQIGYHSVRKMLNSLHSILDVSLRLNISRYKTDKMVAYLTRYNLLSPSLQKKFLPLRDKSFDYTYLYSIATTNEQETISRAKNHYRVSRREMYYFYYDPDIQKSIFTRKEK